MMVTKIWIIQVISALFLQVYSTELLPERYLKPKDFNYHPFTDVGIPAALRKALKAGDSYAILSKKRPREGREFPPQSVVIYPTPHPSVISKKYVDTNEIGKYDDPYVKVPKNYAFSYIVKDQHSGDDFSHSQAHNGKATKGQYRVKLPDGRTQIVSYTADSKGYRADVQYEDNPIPKPVNPSIQSVPETSINLKVVTQNYQPNHLSHSVNNKPSVVYTVTASPLNYVSSSTTAAPVQYVSNSTPLNLVVKSTEAPHYYQPQYLSTAAGSYLQQQYVTSTAAPYAEPHYVAPTAAPQYIPHHVFSTPLYPVQHAPENSHSPVYRSDPNSEYQVVSSTASSDHAVIVTPRPAYNSAIRKNEQQSAPLYYRLL